MNRVTLPHSPEYDDLLHGLLVLAHLHTFDWQDMLKIQEEKPLSYLKLLASESFNRSKHAMNVPPKQYLGDSWNPENPDYQAQRKMFKKLADKIFGKDE